MNKRQSVETAVGKVLDATTENQISGALQTLAEQNYAGYKDATTNLDQAYAIVRGKNQVLGAVVNELICRKVVAEMSATFDAGGAVGPAENYEPGGRFDEVYALASPASRRFLATLHFWFYPALQSVLNDGRTGAAPAEALLAMGETFYREERLPIGQRWIDTSNHPRARLLRSQNVRMEPTFQGALENGITFNLGVVARLLIGRAVASGASSSPATKAALAASQLPQMATLSGTTTTISAPLFDKPNLLELYSLWENGKLSDREFWAEASVSDIAVPDANFHPKQERWQHTGHCSADVAFVRSDLFPVAPQSFLARLAINPVPNEISMAHILLGSSIPIARDTIFASWPSPSKMV